MSKKTSNPFEEYQAQFFELWNQNLGKIPGMDAYSKMLETMQENMAKLPGMDAYTKMFESMQDNMSKLPGMEAYTKMYETMQENMSKFADMQAYTKMFQDMNPFAAMSSFPGMDAYTKMFDGMPKMDDLFDYWKKFSTGIPGLDEYWKSVSEMMPDMTNFAQSWPYKIPGLDSMAKLYDLWQGMADPVSFARDFQDKYMDFMQDVFKGFLPEGATELMQRPMDFMDTCVNYYKQNFAPLLEVDEDILKRIANGDLNAYTDFFREFNAKYEETIGKYYNMMGLGLNRESNEDVMKAMSAYNKAMFATGELMSMVMSVSGDSATKLTTAYQNAITEGKVPTTFREFYDLWSSTTEEELVKLLNTDEFSKTFDNFADMYSQYMSANNKVIERMLSGLPIPTNTDMKSLYKTVYDLRKEVRDLKRAIAGMQEKESGGKK
ncbi:MAG: hypothetical protein IJ125_09835 [Atopobiaceae bacterium]|nr:hypothetical protein [Atopobiaceae bacterium]